MKKLSFLVLVLGTMLSSCSNDEIQNQDAGTSQFQNNVDRGTEPGSSQSNPIVVGSDRFVDQVTYTIKDCQGDYTKDNVRIRGNFFNPYNSSGVGTLFFLQIYDPIQKCVTGTNTYIVPGANITDVIEYKFGVYYKVFGKVARLIRGGFKYEDKWAINTSNPRILQVIYFNADGSFQLGNRIRNPF